MSTTDYLVMQLEGLRRRAGTTSELAAITARQAALTSAGAAYDAAVAARVVLREEPVAEPSVRAAYERAPRILTDTLAALIAGAATISYTPSPAWTLSDGPSLRSYAALLLARPGAPATRSSRRSLPRASPRSTRRRLG